jgi:hypothetical protein
VKPVAHAYHKLAPFLNKAVDAEFEATKEQLAKLLDEAYHKRTEFTAAILEARDALEGTPSKGVLSELKNGNRAP